MSLKKNLIANFLGQGWAAVVGLAFIPFYISYLGIEAYGLIGIYLMLQTWLGLFDLGMSPTLNREVARHKAGAVSAEALNDLVRTCEWITATIALVIALSVGLLAEGMTRYWLNAVALTPETISRALVLMGLVAALRFAESPFRGILLGAQRHVWLNAVSSVLATVRALGAIAVLVWVEATITAFFFWQVIVSALNLAVFIAATRRLLPASSSRAGFSSMALSRVWQFAGGISATTLLALLLTQIDKLILSQMLSLEAFGVYMFAWAVAGSLFQLIGPVAQTWYPQLSELYASGDMRAVARVYHLGAQLMTLALVPIGLTLILFAESLLLIWSGDPHLSADSASLVAVLAGGIVLNGLMHIPYMLQLAAGWTAFAVRLNLVAVLILMPAILWAVPRYGPVAAAWIWLTVNAGYVLIGAHFMFRRLLPQEKWPWYGFDLILPACCAGAVLQTASFFRPALKDPALLAWVSMACLLAMLIMLPTMPHIRAWIHARLLGKNTTT